MSAVVVTCSLLAVWITDTWDWMTLHVLYAADVLSTPGLFGVARTSTVSYSYFCSVTSWVTRKCETVTSPPAPLDTPSVLWFCRLDSRKVIRPVKISGSAFAIGSPLEIFEGPGLTWSSLWKLVMLNKNWNWFLNSRRLCFISVCIIQHYTVSSGTLNSSIPYHTITTTTVTASMALSRA